MRVLKLKIWIRNMSDTLTLDPTHWPRNPVPAEMHRIECQCLSVMHWSAVVSLDTVGETSEHVVMSAAVFDTDNFHFVVGYIFTSMAFVVVTLKAIYRVRQSGDFKMCQKMHTVCHGRYPARILSVVFASKMTFRHTACALLSFWASFEAGGCIVRVLVSLGCSSIAYCVLIQ